MMPVSLLKKLDGRVILQKTLKNLGWLIVDKLIRLCLNLIVLIWLARYLGPGQFGLLNFAIAFSMLFSPLASFGIDSLVVRNLRQAQECEEEILGTSFVLKLFGGMLSALLAVFAIRILHPDDTLQIWLVGIVAAGAVFQAFDVIDFWFQSQLKAKYSVFAKCTVFILVSMTRIGLITLGAPLVAFAWIGTAEFTLTGVAFVGVYQLTGRSIRSWSASITRAKALLADSWPLILSGIVSVIYLRIDQVMLGEMVGAEEVGIYSAAVRIAEAWYFVPMVIYSSVFPSIIDAKKDSEELFYHRLQRLYNCMAFIGYCVAIPASFAAGYIIEVFYGTPFVRAGAMLMVLLWAGIFVSLGVARSAFLMTMNWTKVHFFTVFLGSVVNVLLNFCLIPRYGGLGAAIASLLAYWVAAHGSCLFYKPLARTGWMITQAMLCPKFW